jgi:GT2 family glycosyltransferase
LIASQEPKPPSVLIGVPTNGDVKMHTVLSLVMATNLLRTMGHDMTFTAREGPYTHWNREHLLQDAIKEGVDYLMFVDTDVFFPAEGIPKLISHKKDIVGGMYNLKQDEVVTTIKLWKEGKGPNDFVYGGEGDHPFRAVSDEPLPSGLFPVAALPTGFMLIDVRRVKEAMAFPYFPCDFGLGEDVAFCVNAQKAGLECWCDPTIQIKHIGNKAY